MSPMNVIALKHQFPFQSKPTCQNRTLQYAALVSGKPKPDTPPLTQDNLFGWIFTVMSHKITTCLADIKPIGVKTFFLKIH